MTKKNKNLRTMEEVSKGYEAFIKGKELNSNGRKSFDNAIKKAAQPIKNTKQHGLK